MICIIYTELNINGETALPHKEAVAGVEQPLRDVRDHGRAPTKLHQEHRPPNPFPVIPQSQRPDPIKDRPNPAEEPPPRLHEIRPQEVRPHQTG